MQCSFCTNTFNSKSSLKHHQKTARYCLKLQGVKSKCYVCSTCEKTFSNNYNLSVHIVSCNQTKVAVKLKKNLDTIESKLENALTLVEQKECIIKEQKQQIKELQDKLENVAIKAVQRPTTSNKTQINNYIQNMKPVTDESLLDNVQYLTIDHIKKGPEGYAEYALEYPLKDRMLCSDYSRRKVKFKDNEGNLITDPEMTVLAKRFFESIKKKNKELICKSANELKEKLGDDNVMDTVVKLFDYKSDIEKGSYGEKTEFHHDFVKQVCSQSIKE